LQLRKREEQRIMATEMDYWLRAAGISSLEKIRNERVGEIMRMDGNIVEDIRKKQLIWYGHVKRMEEVLLPEQLLEWHAEGRRCRGRPRTTYVETGYPDGNGREESAGRRLDGQRTVENFGNRKALKDVTNRMMMMMMKLGVIFEVRT
jgi:hypothetical protein